MNQYLKIINLETVDSTNEYAWEISRKEEREIIVVRADTQTSGRGRRGRKWSSPQGKGIYVSFILKPQAAPIQISFFPLVFSLSVVRLLKGIVSLKIKLPNDVLSNGKKIAGVLVEAKSTGERVDCVVLGIGVNINSRDNEIPPQATSLYLETENTYDIGKLFKKLVRETVNIYEDLKRGNIDNLLKEVSLYTDEPWDKLDFVEAAVCWRQD